MPPPIRLFPVEPYDFHLSAMIFSGGDPQIRTYDLGTFRQVLDVRGRAVLVEVFSRGTADAPELYFTVSPDVPANGEPEIINLVASMFNIREDITPFYRAMEKDPVMASLVSQLHGVKSPTTPTVFEALVDSVIEQQISLRAAHSIEKRFIREFGSPLVLGDLVYYGYPAPGTLSGLSDSAFRACGLARRKGEYIRSISRQVISGELDLEHLRTFPSTEAIVGELIKIRGVGRWTAELTILRGLHRPDAFPADDIGVRRLIARFYLNNKKISADEARTFSERWGKWKGYAAYYLVIADLLGISPA